MASDVAKASARKALTTKMALHSMLRSRKQRMRQERKIAVSRRLSEIKNRFQRCWRLRRSAVLGLKMRSQRLKEVRGSK